MFKRHYNVWGVQKTVDGTQRVRIAQSRACVGEKS